MRFGIAMVAQVFYPSIGGAQTHTLRLSQKLRERDADVIVITRHHKGLARYEEIDGVPTYRVGNGDLSKVATSLSFVGGSLRKLYQLRERYQIVHCHQMMSPMTVGLAARIPSNKQLVINPHRSGNLGDIGVLTLRRPVTGRFRLMAARRWGDAFVCISPAVRQELADAGIPAKRLWSIANGVDVDHFAPIDEIKRQELRRSLGLPDGPLALFAGRIVREKGLDVLLRAWPAVLAQVPTARLLIVGEGDKKAELQELAGSLGINDQVIFAPGTANVLPYLHAANVFVLPSFAEGLPVALLEAMAASLSCVATATSGSLELIEDGVTGRAVAIGEPAPLAAGLIEALSHPVAATWARQAREKIIAQFSLDSVADRYIEMYETLLGMPTALSTTIEPSSRATL
jgi:glycosyltransferase involved in cell wall biosynthesis